MGTSRFVDTHCHIHDPEFAVKYEQTSDELIHDAKLLGVDTIICVGTDISSSEHAVKFIEGRPGCYAAIAMHPHEATTSEVAVLAEFEKIIKLGRTHKGSAGLVAIGECGLDYFYHESDHEKTLQKKLFIKHIELAQELGLPLIFHIREAFDDFFAIVDTYPGLQGVVHSFSAGPQELEGVLSRGFYVGLNGIMTFTKDEAQLKAAEMVPLEKMLLETDAPFLTPKPFRGKICKPEHVVLTAEFLSTVHNVPLQKLAAQTTTNAHNLFGV